MATEPEAEYDNVDNAFGRDGRRAYDYDLYVLYIMIMTYVYYIVLWIMCII